MARYEARLRPGKVGRCPNPAAEGAASGNDRIAPAGIIMGGIPAIAYNRGG